MKVEIMVNPSNAKYCPKCGKPIEVYLPDGSALCKKCGFAFAVVENTESKELADAILNHFEKDKR